MPGTNSVYSRNGSSHWRSMLERLALVGCEAPRHTRLAPAHSSSSPAQLISAPRHTRLAPRHTRDASLHTVGSPVHEGAPITVRPAPIQSTYPAGVVAMDGK